MKELFMFLIVLVVFLLAYGISSQGLLYKERSPDWVILKDIVYFPYWQLYGELFLDEIDSMYEIFDPLPNNTKFY